MSGKREKRSSLFLQLSAAIVLGVVVGWLWPALGADLKPVADAFIKLIKMLIAPIVFCTVVLGVASAGDLKSVGRIGVKALVYFEAVTTFALVFGLVIGNLARPGSGFRVDPAALAAGADVLAQKTQHSQLPHAVEFLLGVIPASVIGAFAENALLQVLFFSVLFGLALAKLGESGPPVVLDLVDQLSKLFFTIMGWVMRLAPLGAFGAMAFIIGQYGISSLGGYAKLIACCYLAAALFLLVLAAIAKCGAGVSLWRFVVYAKDELFLALGTASTEVVLPRIMVKLEEAGCSRATTGLVVPTGYSFNLDGATLYLSLCVLFLAQALGVDLTLGEQITAVLVLMLTSKGMAGVPGSSFLALSATVEAIGHGAIPVAAVALLLGADRIMDSMRVSVNLLGNCVATFVVANWEGQLDKEHMRSTLSRR
ncbi:sodium:dicarboxylate symporter [Segniliparus rotundus DSM 44985]|uniref:Sodium:dicarboxylate symporter n=1 Tax=Segniliparus rotundus (strain ATCC BAA-972 / CDC 1076 / CIP 108378 / DSM 44985 / JCM 13578) TaxID=640132 RepID=D6ZDT3_SEGRD|nr:C4-dicarboxylate transporter DctA [Segniliparus rotundus]ADG99340.1 sodium:dicarboxylate symporter [Segniliparus rotundus DSM 44985]